jgi:predicted Kef-type K+ transport protein
MIIIVVFVALVFLYSLLSRRLEHTIGTALIVFTSAGILLILALPGFQKLDMQRESFLKLADLGLVMLLFTDATHINLKTLRDSVQAYRLVKEIGKGCFFLI